eukprot:CAMPEP_0113838574 /NCGR_PEP_ID=MMETSP0328-20130328/10613_1 /TAXON_ID=39455 /ORGANISM="Alexandrium minutum" /LENGTH=94 /DNA_ID=CAMNT_0000807119 /DNA_START=324 /DNA_END=605 /DNA_ORIENTATION=+ /assembly_acc=CAM_ASM_000350
MWFHHPWEHRPRSHKWLAQALRLVASALAAEDCCHGNEIGMGLAAALIGAASWMAKHDGHCEACRRDASGEKPEHKCLGPKWLEPKWLEPKWLR